MLTLLITFRTRKIFNVVLASPSDVAEERKIAEEVVSELNKIFRNFGRQIDLHKWEDASPAALSALVPIPESPESILATDSSYPAISPLQFCQPMLSPHRRWQTILPAASATASRCCFAPSAMCRSRTITSGDNSFAFWTASENVTASPTSVMSSHSVNKTRIALRTSSASSAKRTLTH